MNYNKNKLQKVFNKDSSNKSSIGPIFSLNSNKEKLKCLQKNILKAIEEKLQENGCSKIDLNVHTRGAFIDPRRLRLRLESSNLVTHHYLVVMDWIRSRSE